MRIGITGGSGALGRALLDRLTQDGADRLVTFSRDEHKRALLARTYSWHPGFRVYAGDVRDLTRLVDIFSGCDAVIHAAARKVVTGHPDEPEEMLKTNVVGTLNVIEAAKTAGVRKLVVVSSDKAVQAVNVYGTSKALGEHLSIMANARTFPAGLRVGVVRYGNVLGSTGSVLVRWRAQHAAGEPLSITDPEMTRFWITLPQAVDVVLSALASLRGGEIVVPDLLAASIRTLAEAVAGPDVRFAPVDDPVEGVNAPRQGGEKLYEELVSSVEARRVRWYQGRYVVPPFQHAEMWDATPWLGEPVPGGFAYRSDTWPKRLTVEAMRDLIGASACVSSP